MTPIADPEQFAQRVREATGRWHGRGHGEYPTIETFTYREELELDMREGEQTLRYEQRTWRVTEGGEVPSHWEVGLLWMDDGGGVSMSSAQNGRAEALRGRASDEDGRLVLDLAGVDVALDPRVAATRRTIHIDDDAVEYEMAMATVRVAELRPHLRARLTR